MVLVTGALGFLGRFVMSALEAAAVPAIAGVRPGGWVPGRHTGPMLFLDLEKTEPLRHAASQADGLIHLACTLSSSPAEILNKDVRGTQALAEGWRRGPLIYTSSMDVYPIKRFHRFIESDRACPGTPYGLGKLMCEHALQAEASHPAQFSRQGLTIVRLPFVIGPDARCGSSLFGRLVRCALRHGDFHVASSEDGSSWVSAQAVAEAFAGLLREPGTGIINMASGWVTWVEALQTIIALTGSRSRVRFEPPDSPLVRVNGRILHTERPERRPGCGVKGSFRAAIESLIHSLGQSPATNIHRPILLA